MIGDLFEGATPLVERLAARGPFRSPDALQRAAREIIAGLADAEKIAVINSHPRIGAPPEAVRAQSPASFREQGYDREVTAPEVLREFVALNERYEAKFGFRFVVFVNRRSKAEILPELRARLERSREVEMAAALDAVLAIAADRMARETGSLR